MGFWATLTLSLPASPPSWLPGKPLWRIRLPLRRRAEHHAAQSTIRADIVSNILRWDLRTLLGDILR